jgi:hypothetical protein
VDNHEAHRRKSRMVEISLSGSGEGPGWETSRPTLQRYFVAPLPVAARWKPATGAAGAAARAAGAITPVLGEPPL